VSANDFDDRTLRLAGGVELGVLWRELSRRVGRGDEPRRLTMQNLTGAQRTAITDLLGGDRLVDSTCHVRIEVLVRAFGLRDLSELIALAEQVNGPITDVRAGRAADIARRDRLWADLDRSLRSVSFVAQSPSRLALVTRFVEMQRAIGVSVDDIQARDDLHAMLARVLAALPANNMSVAVFAAQVLGDPHGLDVGKPLTRLFTDALRAICESSLESRRDLWTQFGLVVDRVSSTVLLLGVTVPATHGLAGALNPAAEICEPVVLTLRQLQRTPLAPLPSAGMARVVENPSLVEWASDRGLDTGSGCPLICSNGQPTVAVQLALRQLGASGATLMQHSDFDPAGLNITSWMQSHLGTTPWHMTAHAYRLGLELAHQSARPQVSIVGPIPETPWDPELAIALRHHRYVVSEEHVVTHLFAEPPFKR